MSNDLDRYQAFLDQLSHLTRESGVLVSGCGCCGSPFLRTEEAGSGKLEDIEWNSESQEYDFGWYHTTDTVHILRHGYTLCRMAGLPEDWEEGHSWVSYRNVDTNLVEVFCEDCYSIWKEHEHE